MECSTRASRARRASLDPLRGRRRSVPARRRDGLASVPAPIISIVSALDRGCLRCARRYHGLHQIATSAEREILADVGDRPEMLGDEELAPDSAKAPSRRASMTLPGRAGSDHVERPPRIGHRIKPADQLPVLYRCCSEYNRLSRADQHGNCTIGWFAATRESSCSTVNPDSDGASGVRFRRAVGTNDVGRAAGAAGQEKWYRSLGPDNRGDRDRGRALRCAHRAPGQIVPRPSAASRAGLAR